MCCILGLLFRAFPFPTPYPIPFLPSVRYPLHTTSYAKEVNKKLSYRRQNALGIIKTHERNTVSGHILFFYA